jgi:tRNA nucleotidyltransferase (CCA-adding enzyme)
LSQTRTEVYPRPAVLPQVKPASIKDDLARRDFTINAMALELTPGAFGTFIDPHGGTADMENGIVRVLHDRSFTDDPTRIFRCLRFATRLGFGIEPRTLKLLRQAVGQRLPALLTPERVLYELRCICAEAKAAAIVRRVVRERVLEAAWRWRPPSDFLPRFARLARVGMVRNLWGQSPDFAALSLLFVFWLSTLPVTDRFPIRKEEREAAQAIAEFGRLKRKLKRKLKPSAVFRLLCPLPKQALEVLAAVETGKVRKNLRLYLDELRHVRVSTTGNELRALGIAPGPAYRAILDKLLFARLDGKIRTVADEKDLLRRLAGRARRS